MNDHIESAIIVKTWMHTENNSVHRPVPVTMKEQILFSPHETNKQMFYRENYRIFADDEEEKGQVVGPDGIMDPNVLNTICDRIDEDDVGYISSGNDQQFNLNGMNVPGSHRHLVFTMQPVYSLY